MIVLVDFREVVEHPVKQSFSERFFEVLRRVRPSDRSENGPEGKIGLGDTN